MKVDKLFVLLLLYFAVFVTACKKEDDDNNNNNNNLSEPDPITDIDGNIYKTVRIGTQIWTTSNLRATRYSNGDSLPNLTNDVQWKTAITGAYCSYNNDTNYVFTYGRMYNFYAVSDSRNICPSGWHVPTANDWLTLLNYLGGAGNAGVSLKADTIWPETLTYNNTSGFSALPGGHRSQNAFLNIGDYGYYWSSTDVSGTEKAWTYNMDKGVSEVYVYDEFKNYGQSCRCIKN